MSVSSSEKIAVYIFSDASEKAIAAVAYIKVKQKWLHPKGTPSPDFELCGAVLATELAEIISAQLDVPMSFVTYFTDSKVVLGYIGNQTRRFFTYISNRVEKIMRVSSSSQWRYVSTARNPADCATRCSTSVNNLKGSIWFSGQRWLQDFASEDNGKDSFPLINPNTDKELKSDVTVLKISTKSTCNLGCERFNRFSTWKSLVRAIILLKRVARSHKKSVNQDCIGDFKAAETVILKEVQRECFSAEISRITEKRGLQKNSNIAALSPFIDGNCFLRVGGCLNRIIDQVPIEEINPIILPKNHHVSLRLIQHSAIS